MTPSTMNRIAYIFIIVLMIIAIYPFVKVSFFSNKFSELAILSSTGIIGDYPDQVRLGDEVSFQIYLENHEKQTKLYRTVIKLVEDSKLINNSPPFEVDIVAYYLAVVEDNANVVFPVNVLIDQPIDGKLVAELFVFDASENAYLYHDRWVALWIKTIE